MPDLEKFSLTESEEQVVQKMHAIVQLVAPANRMEAITRIEALLAEFEHRRPS